MSYSVYRLSERPDLRDQVDRLGTEAWPTFFRYGDARHWKHLFSTFAEFQILICDGPDKLVALGHIVPLVWNGTTRDLPAKIDEIILRALEVTENKHDPNTVSALAAIVAKEYQGRGLSATIVQEMKAAALQHGCTSLIAPVRPTWKSRYPLIPLEQYVTWTRTDGAPFDPWLRVHWRMGAKQLQFAPNTLTVAAPVAQWEKWTGLPMPGSGEYVIPGALQPVVIDRARDIGVYEDPNVWMQHVIAADELIDGQRIAVESPRTRGRRRS